MKNKLVKGSAKMVLGFCFTINVLFSFGALVKEPGRAPVVQAINRAEFYSALESQDTIMINTFLKILADYTITSSMAYLGALLMKKSALKKNVAEKIFLFKQGRKKLEDAIKKEYNNSEYHFLRLTIQENCPHFLNYHDNLHEDAEDVKQMYKNFPQELKKIVADYSKTSKALKPTDYSY